MAKADAIKVAILGASGYTGAELLRILLRHPRVRIVALTADRKAGEGIETVFPQFIGLGLPKLVTIKEVDWSQVDAAFCALPHGTTQEVIAGLPPHLKVIDLSADFRLRDTAEYAKWYGHEHLAPKLQDEAVYGLTEIRRSEIANARLVANPGCYPTSAQLPLVPLIAAGLIDADDIVIDAKSGVSGAGRGLKESSLYCEAAEGTHAYAVASHRHGPEIEQELSAAAGRPIVVNFTPHLMPMNRGMLSSIYVRLQNGATADDLRAALLQRYAVEPFVQIVPQGVSPQTRHVRGTNACHIGVFADRVKGRAMLFSVIDNLMKGASGQAVQNFNVMFGLPETTGLDQIALFP
ncbi:MAG TPA: N-acetyl-gamma-glutamyl-phosphate reductase [Ferrovibrio sp.]|uniref:N-acetyl-gamma-glutamyl-phosphate reductase n=1 Tax=Ferrovibrio sp. TaxID=1917215 RepID=UPI002ED562FB